MLTSAQVVETSVTVTDNSPFQDYAHLDDHTTLSITCNISIILSLLVPYPDYVLIMQFLNELLDLLWITQSEAI